jgi:hypothetical protein
MMGELTFSSANLCLGIWDPGVVSGVESVSDSDSSGELPGNVGGMVNVRQGVVKAWGGEVISAMVVLVCEGTDGIELTGHRINDLS